MALPLPFGVCGANIGMHQQGLRLLDLVKGIAFGWGHPERSVCFVPDLCGPRVTGATVFFGQNV